MRCAWLDYLQYLKLVIETMYINPVWLIFQRLDMILEKERKRLKKRKINKLGKKISLG